MFNYTDKLINFTAKILIEYPELLTYIRAEKYRAEDTNVSYRQINSLDEAGLLKDKRTNKSGWRNFSLNDLLYLHIINQLRTDFNPNNSKIVNLKSKFYNESVNFKDIGDVYNSEIALIGLLLEVVSVGVLVYSDGEIILTDNESSPSFIFFGGNKDPRGRSCLYLMLFSTFNPTIKKIKQEQDFKDKFNFVDFKETYLAKPADKNQRALLQLVEDKSYSKIIIKKQKNGGVIIQAEEAVDGKGITPIDMLKLIEEKQFANIETVKRDGKIVSYKVRNTIKL